MLKLIKSGFFTTIQDMGRFGYRNKGVPISGAMDTEATSKLNMLLENVPEAPVLEITMTGPTVKFEEDTYISIGGAELSVTLNAAPIENYKVYKINKGDVLSYRRLIKGLRGYLAIKDGFKSKKVLGSSSLYFPITPNSCLGDNAEIDYEKYSDYNPKINAVKMDSFLGESILPVQKGPEFEILTDKQLEELFARKFTVAKENNRMAYQLNETISGHEISMLTSATLPGTVQFTPSGKLIILMKDGQTTGGYPRVLQLTNKAISILSQKKYGDTVSFKLTSNHF